MRQLVDAGVLVVKLPISPGPRPASIPTFTGITELTLSLPALMRNDLALVRDVERGLCGFLLHNAPILTRLRSLNVVAPRVSIVALSCVPFCCPQLQSLRLNFVALESFTFQLLQNLPGLQHLFLNPVHEAKGMCDAAMLSSCLAHLTGLTHLQLKSNVLPW